MTRNQAVWPAVLSVNSNLNPTSSRLVSSSVTWTEDLPGAKMSFWRNFPLSLHWQNERWRCRQWSKFYRNNISEITFPFRCAGAAVAGPHAVASLSANGSIAFKWQPPCYWLKQLNYRNAALVRQGPAGSQIAKFMGPTWGPPGSCRPQMGPMLVPWTLLSGVAPAGGSRGHSLTGEVGHLALTIPPPAGHPRVFIMGLGITADKLLGHKDKRMQ